MKYLLIKFVRFWQICISPLYPSSCRFYPTCSHYAILSIEKYGAFKGGMKAFWRILRCNPWNKGGIDYP
ncbi:protein of unknown function DUF37 [Hydrogenobaculum sp. Y04AAS1]|uniref:Putative membrane protein insertion efficiency factor n=1 Tax=Hydrogenobaculum sp. (strain Y04AAS1) TaxID=380749 RepID=YIDD_HYDS0|nr:RecName: Full=Putative membrane protein insertion efficiency factor [Hydrogenobaculum sp. Y04AAS1]ACG57567.1 protein of unknown function DUF37 [Hydrogenobaculum sp. Y04AAS1]HCT66133.1 membrane protein insertion efficiency factor YidD [Hydrogenobaculum sp.]